jgi:predicted molibdopterin-dependent oxidoreductase YjgC
MKTLNLTIDGALISVPEGTTLLEACRSIDKPQPTLCFLETLTPVNVCRVCVVEVEGSRVLVPSCSRKAEDGMVVHTQTERVTHSRKLVLEFLGSSVDLSLSAATSGWIEEYGADPGRWEARGKQAPKIDNGLYVRDYSRCILCYKCVEACGVDAQNTFAIAVAGRGFEAHISTEFDRPLTDSACVFCGNCIGVCPTGALMFRSEYELRHAELWDEDRQSVTRTICSFCGVGCNLDLHVQDNRIVKVTSPQDHDVTSGHLCIKGRFGYEYVQELGDLADTPIDQVLARARGT